MISIFMTIYIIQYVLQLLHNFYVAYKWCFILRTKFLNTKKKLQTYLYIFHTPKWKNYINILKNYIPKIADFFPRILYKHIKTNFFFCNIYPQFNFLIVLLWFRGHITISKKMLYKYLIHEQWLIIDILICYHL